MSRSSAVPDGTLFATCPESARTGILEGMQIRDIATLASTSLFRGVELGGLEKALGPASIAVRLFPKGSLLLLAGCAYDSLWILLEGSVSADMQSFGGRTIRIETISAPEPLATAVLFAPEPVLPVTVRALVDARAVALPRELVLSLCQSSRAFLANYLADSGARLAAFSERFRLLQFATLRERLADWLLRQVGPSASKEILLPSSKERLAETFGVTRPSLSRGIGELARDGLVENRGRNLLVLDRSGLEAILEKSG
jgi:CRP-like cAMP-binding protein